MIQKILSEIEGRLQEAESPVASAVAKHLYSIYCKMVLKEQRFHSIMDIYAFRVIVHDSDTCYRVLGQMHSLLQASSSPDERLHRHSQGERLSIFAHLDDRPSTASRLKYKFVPKTWIRWQKWGCGALGI